MNRRQRFALFSLLTITLMLLYVKCSTSSDTKGIFWTENKDSAPVKVLTPDVFVDISNRYNEAVVNISTVETIKTAQPQRQPMQPGQPSPFPGTPFDDLFRDFFDRYAPREGMKRQSLGSGFILNSDGYIVTNNHVVEHADEITVVLSDDENFTAKVIGRDPKTDIALIKIDIPQKNKVKTVVLGDSDKMRVGDIVVAIGNPFGLDHTLTQGVVSAKGRSINLGNYDDFIQTDASINPGNSGGPLMNIKGEVIGINTAINAAGQGIGFAIPINMAKDILQQLKTRGKVVRGWLGVYITKMDNDLAKILNLEKPMGAVVTEIQDPSPALDVGIQKGDVITGFNGKKVVDFNDLPRMVAATPPKSKVTLEILRDKKRINKTVTIGELPNEETMAAKDNSSNSDKLGIEVQELSPEIARTLGLGENDRGVVVSNVDPSSVVADKGLRRGDLIQQIELQGAKFNIATAADYRKAISKVKSGTTIVIWLKRRDRSSYIAFTLK